MGTNYMALEKIGEENRKVPWQWHIFRKGLPPQYRLR
jgi:hypothetical protein